MTIDIWNDYESMPLPDVLSFIVDNRGKTVPTDENGTHILIATNCIRNENLYPSYDKVRLLNDDIYENWFRAHPLPGDIIFVNKGTPGRVCMVPDPVDFCIAQDMMAFRVNEDIIYNKYLLAVLRNPRIQAQIAATTVGDVIPHFKKQQLGEIRIPIPPMKIQKRIGDLYFMFCAKEECNKKINKNLEQQVTTAFHNMFGKYEQNSNTHKPLSIIAKFKYGTMPKKNKLGTGHYHAFSGYQIVGTYPEVMFENPQLIIVARGVGGCGDVKYTPANCYLTNLSIAIITEKTMHDDYLYHYLRLHDTKIMNTGSAQPQITVATLEKFEIPIPPEEEMIQFSDFVQPFKQQYRNNQDENKLLSKLRDTLLPKLMTGEVDVSDIDL